MDYLQGMQTTRPRAPDYNGSSWWDNNKKINNRWHMCRVYDNVVSVHICNLTDLFGWMKAKNMFGP